MAGPPGDHHFRNSRGQILVRQGTADRPWLVTWLPDDRSDPNYPGFTLAAGDADFPTDSGPLAAAEWVDKQPWARDAVSNADPPTEAAPLDVPAETWAAASARAASAGWEFSAVREPNGGFTWQVWKEDVLLNSGTSETWDDAKLESILDFPPPGDEQ